MVGRGSLAKKTSGKFYGRDVFNPRRIVRQIVTIQVLWYVTYFFVFYGMALLFLPG